jgi:hypothetical protein
LRGKRNTYMYSDRSTRAIGHYHKLCSLASLSRSDQRTLLFSGDKYDVNKVFIQLDFLPIIQLVEQGLPQVRPHARFSP